MPHGITQCYLPPGRGDIPALAPAEAGTQLSDPRGMQGWVDLVGLLHTEMVYPKTVTHPGTNRARRALTSFIRRTPLTTMPRRQSLPTGSQCLCYTRQMLDRCPSGRYGDMIGCACIVIIFAICFCQGHTGCACRLFTKLLLGRWVGTGVSRSRYSGSSISAWCRSGAALFSEWYSAILTWIHQSAITIDGLHVDKRLKVQEKCIYMTQPYKWMFWLEPTRLAYNDT